MLKTLDLLQLCIRCVALGLQFYLNIQFSLRLSRNNCKEDNRIVGREYKIRDTILSEKLINVFFPILERKVCS